MSTSILQTLQTAIGQEETAGGSAGVGVSLNNPGALKYAAWESSLGATPGANGFAHFPTLDAGWEGLQTLIQNYIAGGASISSMMNAYAPVNDGNSTTPMRIQSLSALTGLNPNTPIIQQVPAASTTSTVLPGSVLSSGVADATVDNSGTSALSQVAVSPTNWVVRGATFVGGVVALIFGLSMLKQTQVIVQPVIDAAKDSIKTAATTAAVA